MKFSTGGRGKGVFCMKNSANPHPGELHMGRERGKRRRKKMPSPKKPKEIPLSSMLPVKKRGGKIRPAMLFFRSIGQGEKGRKEEKKGVQGNFHWGNGTTAPEGKRKKKKGDGRFPPSVNLRQKKEKRRKALPSPFKPLYRRGKDHEVRKSGEGGQVKPDRAEDRPRPKKGKKRELRYSRTAPPTWFVGVQNGGGKKRKKEGKEGVDKLPTRPLSNEQRHPVAISSSKK